VHVTFHLLLPPATGSDFIFYANVLAGRERLTGGDE
jgi:hypothetical protein